MEVGDAEAGAEDQDFGAQPMLARKLLEQLGEDREVFGDPPSCRELRPEWMWKPSSWSCGDSAIASIAVAATSASTPNWLARPRGAGQISSARVPD